MEEIWKKLKNKEELKEYEISYLTEFIEDEKIIDTGRWVVYYVGHFKDPDGQWYELNYALGATENQENEFYYQPVRVTRTEKEVTRTEIIFEKVED